MKGYINWSISTGNSITTSMNYLRCLKVLFNDLIREGIISHYPFKGFKMTSNVRSKSVLYPLQIQQLLNYQGTGKMETRAQAYWFFLYLTNGINFKDMCMLKFKNINGDILTFIREKTKNTSSSVKEIQVFIHPKTRDIINQWGNQSQTKDDYIFPIINKSMTPIQIQQTISRHKRCSNKMLSRIGRKLNFNVHLTTNLARHSFATSLKIHGVPTSSIGDAMGHSNSTITEHYLKSLPSENLKIMSNTLLKFIE